MKSKDPLDLFFKMAPKDPIRKAMYDYYLFWIIFLAFGSLALLYFQSYIVNGVKTGLFWGLIMSIICYFNFNTLNTLRNNLKMLKNLKQNPIKLDNKFDMLKSFDNEDKSQTKDNIRKKK